MKMIWHVIIHLILLTYLSFIFLVYATSPTTSPPSTGNNTAVTYSLVCPDPSQRELSTEELQQLVWKSRIITYYKDITYSRGNLVPPEEIPSRLLDYYTRCNTIKSARYYVDDTMNGAPVTLNYPYSEIFHQISQARKVKDFFAFT